MPSVRRLKFVLLLFSFAGGPAFAVAVKRSGRGLLGTKAATMCASLIFFPRVNVVLAAPAAVCWPPDGARLPPPAATRKPTRAPFTGLPAPSRSTISSAVGSAWPAAPVCASPFIVTVCTGTVVAATVNVTGAKPGAVTVIV